ncbi:MAG: DNA repair protein RecO [Eubacteriales bacterium]|nr:DNA repair protein RecO [Eubacteriales bacterium]
MDEKTNGIVIRAVNYGESDKILTILTPEGRLSASARGCRKNNAKLKYAGELFCMGEFCFTQTKGKRILTACTPVELFYDLREDIVKLAAATYMANLIEAASEETDSDTDLFVLFITCLKLLVYSDKTVREVLLLFTLKLALVCGYRPVLDRCVVCGREQATRFSLRNGGVVCGLCTVDGDYEMPKDVALTFSRILDSDLDACGEWPFAGGAGAYHVRMMIGYMTEKLGCRPKSLSVLLTLL